MRFRFASAIGLLAVIASSFFFSGYSCQKSGLGNLGFNYVRFNEFQMHQTFTSSVPADEYVDEWNGYVPFNTDFGRMLSVDGSFKPPTGATLPFTTFSIQPFIACPESTQTQPTVPPVVQFTVNPTNYSFSNSFPLTFPSCSGTTGSINKILKQTYLQLQFQFDAEVPANTEISAKVSTN
jgi:hypothetical protein